MCKYKLGCKIIGSLLLLFVLISFRPVIAQVRVAAGYGIGTSLEHTDENLQRFKVGIEEYTFTIEGYFLDGDLRNYNNSVPCNEGGFALRLCLGDIKFLKNGVPQPFLVVDSTKKESYTLLRAAQYRLELEAYIGLTARWRTFSRYHTGLIFQLGANFHNEKLEPLRSQNSVYFGMGVYADYFLGNRTAIYARGSTILKARPFYFITEVGIKYTLDW